MNIGRGQYSAAAPALGYFYQCRYALFKALCYLRKSDMFMVSIETLDDVVFGREGLPVEILQTKHHLNAKANLTDTSPDLWKTFRIWIEGLSDNSIPLNTRFFLITTSTCGSGTAAYYLCCNSRDEAKAIERLTTTALTSTNRENAIAYSKFLSLSDDKKATLIKSIAVIDASPSIDQLDEQMRSVVFYSVKRQYLDSYLQRLEGWWYGRIVKHLRDDQASPILSEEIEAEINRIRSQFREESLPIDDDIMNEAVDSSVYRDKNFVAQLNLIGVNGRRIFFAIRDYYRAFTQRSRWIREDLLCVGDLGRYEGQLIEEWELQFEQMRDELGDNATEEKKKQAARELYAWVETGTHSLIRPAVTEPAIARGSYQMLADDLEVGWHIEFREHLESLLGKSGVTK